MRFFVGLHQPSDAKHFDRCFISVNRLRRRRTINVKGEWIMDSGAFTEISNHGGYRHSPAEYAAEVRRWADTPGLLACVAQDYMCESFILEKTARSVEQHHIRGGR